MNPEESYKSFSSQEIGAAIKKARRSKRISQKMLASMIDKAERTVQKYESGEIIAGIPVLKEIGNALDMPWFEIIGIMPKTIAGTQVENSEEKQYSFNSLGDIMNALLMICSHPEDLNFEISLNKPPQDSEWSASFTINGKGSGKYDADFCLFIENWMNHVKNKRSHEEHLQWQRDIIRYYSDSRLSTSEDTGN